MVYIGFKFLVLAGFLALPHLISTALNEHIQGIPKKRKLLKSLVKI